MRGFIFILCISWIHTTFFTWDPEMKAVNIDLDVLITMTMQTTIYAYAGYHLSFFPLF